ncbi:hypothetical protein LTR08_006155 [Meristemomyces frigidus]|nr:hypothetical protein LTR08_006155 [Meristemomyces frigidus]
MASQKPVHTLVLDTGAIIRNDPSVSTLIGSSETLVTVPAIISEIKDAATRSRVEVQLQPFLTLRSPSLASIKVVTDFARKTGDLAVLSKPDIQIIALTYEIECERNNGDWRLRKNPGQKGVNGAPPGRSDVAPREDAPPENPQNQVSEEQPSAHTDEPKDKPRPTSQIFTGHDGSDIVVPLSEAADSSSDAQPAPEVAESVPDEHEISEAVTAMAINEAPMAADTPVATDIPVTAGKDALPKVDSAQNSATSQEDSASDSEGWITPSNLKKRQAEDAGASTVQAKEQKTMQVGVLTTDFAMQNVILQMNLNLLSSSMTRVKHLKTFVLRCHACFQVSKDMSKQFCLRCGQPALTRVSCSTSANGEFKLHLKKNMQWNTRGDRYSIPKPVHGAAHGRLQGGGKGGWGNELILAEDQKEFERANTVEKRQKERSLMDEDYLPSILTGDRGRVGGRTKVGAGRNVNARKRH